MSANKIGPLSEPPTARPLETDAINNSQRAALKDTEGDDAAYRQQFLGALLCARLARMQAHGKPVEQKP